MELPEIDAEEAEMRELGRQADLEQGRPISEPTSANQPETRAPGEGKPAEPTPSEWKEGRTQPVSSDIESQQQPKTQPEPPEPRPPEPQPGRDEFGRFKARTDGPQPTETDYARAQKEEARKNRSWANLQAEKERVRAREAQIEEAQRMAYLQQQAEAYAPPKKDGLTAEEYYRDGYLRFKEQGDNDAALKSLETALELQQQEAGTMQQRQQAQVEYRWRRNMEQVLHQRPDLGDPRNPVAQETDRIINENPWVVYIPQGFARIAEIAEILVDRNAMSELREENEQLRAELEKERYSKQPARGGPSGPPRGAKPQEEMSLEEEEEFMRHQTDLADSYSR